MYYELRTYDIAPGRLKPAIDRIADHGLGYLRKHGIRPLVYMEPVIGTAPQLVYLIEWESLADREARWESYVTDPGWVAVRVESERDGPIVVQSRNLILRDVPSIMAKLKEGETDRRG